MTITIDKNINNLFISIVEPIIGMPIPGGKTAAITINQIIVLLYFETTLILNLIIFFKQRCY